MLVAHGARDGGALIEGILPDDEMHRQRPAAKATPGAVQALEPQRRARLSCRNAELPPIVLGSDLAESIGAICGRFGAW